MTVRILLIASFLLVFPVFLGCEASSNVTDSGVRTETSKSFDLELLDWGWETGEFGIRYLTGQVRNNADKTWNYVQITFATLDDSGAQLGSALDNVNNLGPGRIWKFSALVFEDVATKAEVTELTGF